MQNSQCKIHRLDSKICVSNLTTSGDLVGASIPGIISMCYTENGEKLDFFQTHSTEIH